MATIADLVIGLRTDTSKLKSGLGGAMGSVRKFSSSASRGFGKVAQSAGRMGLQVGKAAMAGSLVAGGAIAAFAVKGVSAFSDFQKGMDEVFTLMPGASKDAMGKMTQDVKDFGREFGVLSADTIPALYTALSAGVPADNVFDFLTVAQQASIGGVTDLAVAVDGISGVINSYGEKAESATAISDKMFTAVRLGKTTFDELSQSLFNVLPTAAGLGVKFGEVTAAMAALTASGTPTSVATIQLRNLMSELTKGTGAATRAFNDVSGVSFPAFVAAGGTLAGALQIIKSASDESGVSMLEMFNNVSAGNAALSLTSGGMEAFTDDLAAMEDSAGATKTAFDKFGGGLSLAFGKVKSAGELLMIAVGKELAPVFIRFANWLVEKAPVIQKTVASAFKTIAEVLGGLGTAAVKLAEGDWKGAMAEFGTSGKIAFDAIEGALTHFTDVVLARVTENIKASVAEWISELFNFENYWNGLKDIVGMSLGDVTGVSVPSGGKSQTAPQAASAQRSENPIAAAMQSVAQKSTEAAVQMERMAKTSEAASEALDGLADPQPVVTLSATMALLSDNLSGTVRELSGLSISRLSTTVESAVMALADLPVPLLDEAVGGLLERFRDLARNASELGLGDLGTEINEVIATLSAAVGTSGIKNAVDLAASKFREIEEVAGESLQGAMDDVAAAADGTADMLKSSMSPAVADAADAMTQAATGLADDIPPATASVAASIESMSEKVGGMMTAAVEKMSAGMDNLAGIFSGSMQDAVASIREAFASLAKVTETELAPALSAASVQIGAFGRAMEPIILPGNIYTGTGTGLGDIGNRSAASVAGPTINLNIAGSVMTERDITLAVRRGFGAIARQNVTSGVF